MCVFLSVCHCHSVGVFVCVCVFVSVCPVFSWDTTICACVRAQDEDSLKNKDDVRLRNYSAGVTGEDHFDKEALPKVLQRKNFGKKSGTKYTHLVDQDTTQWDSARAKPADPCARARRSWPRTRTPRPRRLAADALAPPPRSLCAGGCRRSTSPSSLDRRAISTLTGASCVGSGGGRLRRGRSAR